MMPSKSLSFGIARPVLAKTFRFFFSEMFTQIMLIIQPWYYFADEQQPQQAEEEKRKKAQSSEAYQRLLLEPFARVQDTCQSSVLVRKLNWIGDTLVKHSDPQLYHHLEKLDIPPQIYGM